VDYEGFSQGTRGGEGDRAEEEPEEPVEAEVEIVSFGACGGHGWIVT
jgi:hypothetical protein